MELISVIMPTYNVLPYIEEAVESIINQTWSNLELIIVDDCSNDGTYEFLLSKYNADERIKIYRNNTNLKICKSLNRAYLESKGDYIVRMDGDDVSVEDRIAVLKHFLDNNPDIDLVGSQVISIDEDGKTLSNRHYLKTDKYIKKGNKYGPSIAHIWMAKRKVYEELGGYRNIPFAEDYDFLLRGEIKGFRYANVDRYLYKVRIRHGNTGSSNGLKQRKAKELVRNLYLLEKKNPNKVFFNDNIYNRKTACTKFEKKRYELSYMHLNKAIRSRSNPVKLIINTGIAALESQYMFNYLFDSLMMRLLIIIENLKIKTGE